jgi:8-oxo-dGTP pyrophosphatase MutT (NUDIX family)
MTCRLVKFSKLRRWQMDLQAAVDSPAVLLFDDPPKSVTLKKDDARIEQSADYLRGREQAWDRARHVHGDKLWNGRVCTVRGISVREGAVELSLSVCEYKDIIFKKDMGARALADLFGRGSVDFHAFAAAVPFTNDEGIVLGVVGGGTVQPEGVLDLVGGSMNVDEQPIVEFDDIRRALARELEEEAGIEAPPSACALVSLNVHDGCCFFLFSVPVDAAHVAGQFRSNRELDGLLTCGYEEMGRLDRDVTADLRLVLGYADELRAVLRGYRDAMRAQ